MQKYLWLFLLGASCLAAATTSASAQKFDPVKRQFQATGCITKHAGWLGQCTMLYAPDATYSLRPQPRGIQLNKEQTVTMQSTEVSRGGMSWGMIPDLLCGGYAAVYVSARPTTKTCSQ